jgi:hypothetical protein
LATKSSRCHIGELEFWTAAATATATATATAIAASIGAWEKQLCTFSWSKYCRIDGKSYHACMGHGKHGFAAFAEEHAPAFAATKVSLPHSKEMTRHCQVKPDKKVMKLR